MSAGEELRGKVLAVRLHKSKMGQRRKLTDEQRSVTAGQFGAKDSMLVAGKKLFASKCAELRAIGAVLREATNCWKSCSVEFGDEDGVRLIHRDRVAALNDKIEELKVRLDEAVEAAANNWQNIKEDARELLGDLYDDRDYVSPTALRHCYAISVDFPNIEPPDFLLKISPELHAKELERVRRKFEQVVTDMEASFAEEFAGIVEAMANSLEIGENGKKKAFRKSRVDDLKEFVAKFRDLQVTDGDGRINELVEKASALVEGKTPEEFAKSLKSANVQDAVRSIKESISSLVVSVPKRALLLDDEDQDDKVEESFAADALEEALAE